jgi:hypothetical protein
MGTCVFSGVSWWGVFGVFKIHMEVFCNYCCVGIDVEQKVSRLQWLLSSAGKRLKPF